MLERFRNLLSETLHNILIFDYDGTLTYETQYIPEITRDALKKIKQRNLATLGIISGRDLPFLKSIDESLSNVFSFLIAENGAVSYFSDLKLKTVLGKEWSERARKIFLNSGIPMHFAEVMFATSIENATRVSDFLQKSKLDVKLVPNRD